MDDNTKIWAAILEERTFQDKKYGPVLNPMVTGPEQGPGGHELAAWLLVIRKELEEAEDAAINGRPQKNAGLTIPPRNTVRAELVQIAAVCVAALEQHGLGE